MLKIGISAGEPVTDHPSLFGDAVKLARRMSEVVQGEVVVSARVSEAWQDEQAGPFPHDGTFVFLNREEEAFLSLLLDQMETVWSDAALKVEDLCRPLGCSKSGLYRKMTLLTGMSPHAFILEYRLRQAWQMAGRRQDQVAGIAYATGFTSPSYFSKCFRRRFGRPPSDFLQ
jgi:AraC-like DNA-binding protein